MFVPARHQPDLPLDRLILAEAAGDDATPLDVLFVGAGPAGLSGAIELARLARADGGAPLEIGVLEKAESLGGHSLSGAVVDPRAFVELFPDLPASELPFRGPVPKDEVYVLTERGKLRIPTPPEMNNHGRHVASLCEIVRWLGEKAEAAGVNVFTGFPAAALLTAGRRVVGVRTAPSGLGRDGTPGPGYAPPSDLAASVVVLSDGTRSALGQAWQAWQGIGAPNPQIYALGVKELWDTKRPLGAVVHTMGWPLPSEAFGGSFLYPMGGSLVALGLVVGLDYPGAGLDVHGKLQQLKSHPHVRSILEGGEMLEWGAKTIPEGGYWSIPDRLTGDGLVLVGDAAGLVNVAALKGIHYAMQSGILAARAIHGALRRGDTSATALSTYDAALRGSWVIDDLRRTRNMRLAFKSGFVQGGVRAGLMSLSGGRLLGRRIPVEPDAHAPRRPDSIGSPKPDGKYTFSKVDAVFRSGNATRDDGPSHLVVGRDVPPEVAEFYSHMCPAGVYERQGDRLLVHAPNCVDCKATDVLGPRWQAREGGSGPRYQRM
jgi:electron-transferring-flavoprotein dehydrogenase